MEPSIKITANIAKTTIDAKKAVVTLELAESDFKAIPSLAAMTGQWATVHICESQMALDLDGE